MIELLAPAGSMEALKAAVQNGANAVYLGCGSFNARQSAKNFTIQTLSEAVKYCHVRGVQVHLTLNTLVSDREMDAAAELIRQAINIARERGYRVVMLIPSDESLVEYYPDFFWNVENNQQQSCRHNSYS